MADDTPVVLVTGAAHGLGREVARQLAATGREVIITARDAAQAGRAAGELGPTVSALPVGLHAADPGSVTAAAQALTASPGRLDVLVNNAAAFVDWTETATGADLDAASYGISKAALNALTSTLAAELAGTSVLVNSVCPGLTATWPGAEGMGARPVGDSAPGVAWAATLPDGGPSGGFFRDTRPLPW